MLVVRTRLTQKHVAFRQGRDLESALASGVQPPLLFLRGYSESALRRTPAPLTAASGGHLPLCRVGTSQDGSSRGTSLQGCFSPVALTLAALTSGAAHM